MKKIISLLITAVLLFSFMTVSVSAENYKGSDSLLVDFNGTKLNSSFSSKTLTDEMSRLEPGDSIDITISLKNTSGIKTDWYMSNEVLTSLEESSKAANGGAYTYRLAYYSPAGAEKIIFDGDSIGGDTGNIKTSTGSLKDFFFLGTLSGSQAASVKLSVSLDGETEGNSYFNTLAKLQMNFAVEKGEGKTEYGVKTGDAISPVIWVALLCVSVAAVIILSSYRRRISKGGRA